MHLHALLLLLILTLGGAGGREVRRRTKQFDSIWPSVKHKKDERYSVCLLPFSSA